jgi:hypothetical protein
MHKLSVCALCRADSIEKAIVSSCTEVAVIMVEALIRQVCVRDRVGLERTIVMCASPVMWGSVDWHSHPP